MQARTPPACSGAGGRANECGFTREYGWPSPLLRFLRRAEPGREPFLDERVRQVGESRDFCGMFFNPEVDILIQV